MGIKAIVIDDESIQHLIIGLSRENVDSLLRGEAFTLPSGHVPVLTTGKSNIVVMFAETDELLTERFQPILRSK